MRLKINYIPTKLRKRTEITQKYSPRAVLAIRAIQHMFSNGSFHIDSSNKFSKIFEEETGKKLTVDVINRFVGVSAND